MPICDATHATWVASLERTIKMSINRFASLITVTFALALVPAALANDFDLSWFTIDGGGGYSAGGSFKLEGTIGQPDAGPSAGAMIGGTFELVGGLWPLTTVCNCPGDTNGDGVRDGLDIQTFVHCAITGFDCDCANVDGTPGVNENDVAVFVNALLIGNGCS
ncbi:MAG TPA: hypothetical protein VNT79_16420 [Phycisphaerae bacterium]|nr:hypothetical protein [Phycisphaerae bacterium]